MKLAKKLSLLIATAFLNLIGQPSNAAEALTITIEGLQAESMYQKMTSVSEDGACLEPNRPGLDCVSKTGADVACMKVTQEVTGQVIQHKCYIFIQHPEMGSAR